MVNCPFASNGPAVGPSFLPAGIGETLISLFGPSLLGSPGIMSATPEASGSHRATSLASCIRFLAQYRWQFLATYLILLCLVIGTLMPTFKGNHVTVLKGEWSPGCSIWVANAEQETS